MPTKEIETSPQKVALESTRPDLAVFVGATMGNGFTCGKGNTLGIITSSSLIRRRTRSLVAGTAFATNSAAGTVADGTLFKVGDVLTNSAGANVGTITAIVGNNITLAANAAVAVAIGAAVLGSDGSQVAKGFTDEGSDGIGDTQIPVCIGGYLVEANLSGLDSTAKTELGGISTVGGIFKF
jgi:hypothetical protein